MRLRPVVAGGLTIAALGLGLWLACAHRSDEAPAKSQLAPAPVLVPAAEPPSAPATEPAAEPVQRPAAPAQAAQPATWDEATAMQQLRALQDVDPARTLALAREAERRVPTSSNAPERSAIIVKSLARLGRLSEARGEAERMVNDYPDSPWALEVEQQTGAHSRRNR